MLIFDVFQAIIRPGRFHSYVHIDLPDVADRKQFVSHLLRETHFDSQDGDRIVDCTEGCTMAEVKIIMSSTL